MSASPWALLFRQEMCIRDRIMPSSYVPAGMLTLPVGGFLCLGTLIAIMQWALARSEKKHAEKKETEGK